MKKRIFIITALCAVLFLGIIHFSFKTDKDKKIGPEGTNGNYVIAYDLNAWTLRQKWMNTGSINDSLIVRGANTYFRRIAPLSETLSGYMSIPAANSAIATMQNDINGKATLAQARNGLSLTTTGTIGAATYNPTTGVFNIPVYGTTSRVFNNNVARTLNSNYTISTTRDANVSYSVSLSVTNPLLAGASTASAFLEYSTDGGTNWITVSQAVNSSSVALTVTVAITQPNTSVISGIIPANALVRLRTTTAGTASVSYVRGQEIYL